MSAKLSQSNVERKKCIMQAMSNIIKKNKILERRFKDGWFNS
jgi:hypothetical protein